MGFVPAQKEKAAKVTFNCGRFLGPPHWRWSLATCPHSHFCYIGNVLSEILPQLATPCTLDERSIEEITTFCRLSSSQENLPQGQKWVMGKDCIFLNPDAATTLPIPPPWTGLSPSFPTA